MEKEIFGKFIAQTRRESGLTQKALADKLHVTDKAVSKWERGLCYPDLTLMEDLALALSLTMTELMSCQKNEDSVAEENELAVRSLLDISGEAMQVQRAGIWKRVAIAAAALLAFLIVGAYLILTAPRTAETPIMMKQTIGTDNFIYIEEEGHLIRLHCSDPDMYDAIAADGTAVYNIRARWNEITYQGSVITCEKEAYKEAVGGIMDQVGSAFGVDQLLDRRFVYQEFTNISADPERPNKFLYTFRFFYLGDGSKNLFEGEEITLFTVKNCREVYLLDYDNDGIVELFVLTKYDEEPYLLYDMEDEKIVSRFVDEVPEETLEWFRMQ